MIKSTFSLTVYTVLSRWDFRAWDCCVACGLFVCGAWWFDADGDDSGGRGGGALRRHRSVVLPSSRPAPRTSPLVPPRRASPACAPARRAHRQSAGTAGAARRRRGSERCLGRAEACAAEAERRARTQPAGRPVRAMVREGRLLAGYIAGPVGYAARAASALPPTFVARLWVIIAGRPGCWWFGL